MMLGIPMPEAKGLISVLPDFLINQIAAGEVVENPASVVKELVENSIDAGASKITVEIENGGLTLIHVIDDGCGMSAGDAVVAMERHATSKIRDVADLMAICTMGFRGEALPSIASVSRFKMVTRRAHDDAATAVSAEDGRISVSPCASPKGTSIEVRDLFFNVPARLKFQKGEKVQSAAVADTIRRTSLANPGIHFVLRSGSRVVADYPPCRSLFNRAVMVVGRDSSDLLFPFALERDGIAVSGVLGAPGLSRGDSSRSIMLVNGRPVMDNAVRRAMVSAYSVLMPQSRFPVAVADIRVDPSEVDVNVHPGKHEVRFRRLRDVAGVVFEAMSEVIEATPWIMKTGAAGGVAGFTGCGGQYPAADSTAFLSVHDVCLDRCYGNRQSQEGLFDSSPGLAAGRLRYVGQVADTILVCESEGALVLIDQHAAHERINFNKLWGALEKHSVASEQLLFPEVVQLDRADMERFDHVHDAMEKVGFDLERYSGESIAVRAVPAVIKGRAVAAILKEAISASFDESSGAGDAILRKIVATVACHASVRAGDKLSEIEAVALVDAMNGEAMSSYCPHGRQAVVVNRISDVLKWFDR
jgi:DNA mismatch repair protein MutL